MSDSSSGTSQFPPGFEMLQQMWSMSPFQSMFQGAGGGTAANAGGLGGLNPSLSMMSDMMAPLTNVAELDKRITDMRAVEQWLKLNLNMLQSAIQALEVQRATLATLKAFGAFAQPGAAAESATGKGTGAGFGSPMGGAAADPAAWWGALQNQFNQIAGMAMTAATDGAAQFDTAAKAAAEQAANLMSAAAAAAPIKPANAANPSTHAPGRHAGAGAPKPAPHTSSSARRPAAGAEASAEPKSARPAAKRSAAAPAAGSKRTAAARKSPR